MLQHGAVLSANAMLHTHTHTHTHIHTHTHTTHTHTYTHMHTHTHTYTHTQSTSICSDVIMSTNTEYALTAQKYLDLLCSGFVCVQSLCHTFVRQYACICVRYVRLCA